MISINEKKQSKKKLQNKKKKNNSENTAFANLEKTSSNVTTPKRSSSGIPNMSLIEWQEEYFLQQAYQQY